MTVLQIIRAIAPEFETVSDATIESYIEIFSPLVSKKQFGAKYNLALALLISHKLQLLGSGSGASSSQTAMFAGGSSTFGLSSISAGGESISFSGTNLSNLSTDAEYASTLYGTQYVQLRKMCIIPIRSSGER